MQIPKTSNVKWQIIALLAVAVMGTLASGFFAGSMYSKAHYEKESQQRRALLQQCINTSKELSDKIASP